MYYKRCIVIIFILILILLNGYGEDYEWPGWRGPGKNSISLEEKWDPLKITEESNILWKINAGKGYSSFSIVGKYLYTMGNTDRKDIVWCLDAKTGKEIWSYTYSSNSGQYPGPRCTPLIDGDKLYTIGENGDLYCFNAKTGEVVWKQNIMTTVKAKPPGWNFAGSPVIEGDVLYLNVNKYGIALNKNNGKIIWASPSDKCGYSTPVLCTINNTKSVLLFGKDAIYGVDRNNGKLLWEYGWVTNYDVNVADPVVVDDTVFITSNYGVGCALLKIEKNKPKVIWKNKVMNSHVSSFVFFDGYIYGNDGSPGKGNFECIRLSDGKEMWSEKLGFGSIMATKDYLIMLTERGKLHIAKVNSKKYEEVAQAKVLSNTCWTPPVLCNGRIYCRNHNGDIVSIDVSKK